MPLNRSAFFPAAIAGAAELGNLKDRVPSQAVPLLDGNISNSATSFDVDDGSKLPTDNFFISIEDEIIFVGSRSGNTLSNCTRGAEGTANVAHNDQTEVNAFIIAAHHGQAAAEINAVESALGAGLGNVFGISSSPGAQRRVTIGWPNGTASYQVMGDSVGGGGGTFGGGSPDGVQGVMLGCTTGASQGNDSGFSSNSFNYRVSDNPRMRAVVRPVNAVADARIFIGLSDQSLATMVGADDPVGNYAGFQFSTDRPDTNWKCISKDNSVQEISDSGVAPGANTLVVLEVEIVSGTHVKFYINGALVATHSTRLPGSTVNLRYIVGLETRTGSTKTLNVGVLRIMSDR